MATVAQETGGVRVLAEAGDAAARVLTPEALAFVASLHRRFDGRRLELLREREAWQARLDAGEEPTFRAETASVRESEWRVAPCPPGLEDRRVEITGPTDAKMVINALNSGARCFMADFEDALSPTWRNVVSGQANLMDAVRGTLRLEQNGKTYRLNETRAALIVRPRGWHLPERHLLVDGAPVSASLFDFGLYFFHNAEELLARGAGPWFYLPKLENHREARLWNDVFTFAQAERGVPHGSIRATVLIETVLAAFEMDEILYELRDHAAGLNAGRWDYIFSVIKKFKNRGDFVLPDRVQLTMTVPFMKAYAELLVRTCHRRGAHAMGGMAAFIPSRRDPEVNRTAMAKVQEDKRREASQGFDGTWVAHPDLVPVAKEAFDAVLGDAPHQKHVTRDDVQVTAGQLMRTGVVDGRITEDGVRLNVNVALQYIEAWLQGNGAAALHNLMEDAATAEISRAQLWQWIRHRSVLDDGRPVTPDLYREIRDGEMERLRAARPDGSPELERACELLNDLVLGADFVPFLTLPAYEWLD